MWHKEHSTFAVIATISFVYPAWPPCWESSDLLTESAQDFPIDHKDIDLLRLRSFTLGKKLSDKEVVGPKGMDRIAELISCIEPFVSAISKPQSFDDRPLPILYAGGVTGKRRSSRPTTRCPCLDTSRHSFHRPCAGSAADLPHRQLQRRSKDGAARHHLLLAGLKDRRMGGRGANTVLQITYLNSVVMPDEESSSSEDDDESDDGESAEDHIDE